MAVKSVRQQPFQESTDAKLAPDGTVTYAMTQLWLVITDSINDLDTTSACTATDGTTTVPGLGTQHSTHLFLFVKSQKAQRDEKDGLNTWRVSVTYETIPVTGSTEKWYPKVEVNGVERSEDVHEDIAGNPIVNVVGDPFDPLEKKVYYDEEISVEYNCRTVDFDLFSRLRGKANSDSITLTIRGQSRTFATNTLVLAKTNYTPIFGGVFYFKVAIKLHYKPLNWKRKLVNKGLMFQNMYGKHHIKDAHGVDVTLPQYLDTDGSVLPNGNKVTLAGPTHDGYQIDDLADLGVLLDGIS